MFGSTPNSFLNFTHISMVNSDVDPPAPHVTSMYMGSAIITSVHACGTKTFSARQEVGLTLKLHALHTVIQFHQAILGTRGEVLKCYKRLFGLLFCLDQGGDFGRHCVLRNLKVT